MYKLVLIAAVLSFTSFSFHQPATVAELPFCDGVQLILKKMKAAESLNDVKLTGCITSVKDEDYGTLFIVEAGNDTDSLLKQKKFADIKAQLIKCLHPKKIDVNDPDFFSFEVGTIILELVREKAGLVKNYGVSLWILKPKK